MLICNPTGWNLQDEAMLAYCMPRMPIACMRYGPIAAGLDSYFISSETRPADVESLSSHETADSRLVDSGVWRQNGPAASSLMWDSRDVWRRWVTEMTVHVLEEERNTG